MRWVFLVLTVLGLSQQALAHGLEGETRSGRNHIWARVVDASKMNAPRQIVQVLAEGKTQPIYSLVFRAQNVSVRVVAGDRLLVTVSCGFPCQIGRLYDTRGHQLAELWFPQVDPTERFAASLELLNL